MCNAWNHPPQCACGWGGDGHLGKRAAGNDIWYKNLSFTGLRSYTVPNASCPVYAQAVFFYQSPYGGRVFFDELGPPWPKHPCTDNPKTKQPEPKYHFSENTKQSYKWQASGWMPFVVITFRPLPPEFKLFNITGELNGVEISLYTLKIDINVKAPFL